MQFEKNDCLKLVNAQSVEAVSRLLYVAQGHMITLQWPLKTMNKASN